MPALGSQQILDGFALTGNFLCVCVCVCVCVWGGGGGGGGY